MKRLLYSTLKSTFILGLSTSLLVVLLIFSGETSFTPSSSPSFTNESLIFERRSTQTTIRYSSIFQSKTSVIILPVDWTCAVINYSILVTTKLNRSFKEFFFRTTRIFIPSANHSNLSKDAISLL